MAMRAGAVYYETSARTGEGVEQMYQGVVQGIR